MIIFEFISRLFLGNIFNGNVFIIITMSPNFTFKSLFKNTLALLNKIRLPSHLCGIFCDHVRISAP
jgi:hypothetical protein